MTTLRYWWRDLLDSTLTCLFRQHGSCDRVECHCDCHFRIEGWQKWG